MPERRRMNNYLNLTPSEMSKHIYRIISVDRLVEMFTARNITLTKPHKWDDPFENFILRKARVVSASGKSASFGSGEFVYGQCWSLNNETDAMWRIYAPDKNGVKVRTTIMKLLLAVRGSSEDPAPDSPRYPHYSVSIGKVEYKTNEEITGFLNSQGVLYSEAQGIAAKTLLIKRKAFEHENEVRLIYHDITRSAQGDSVQFPFDPLTVIDEIVFDPRMNQSLVDVLSAWFKESGFKGSILQSDLYRPPKDFTVQVVAMRQ